MIVMYRYGVFLLLLTKFSVDCEYQCKTGMVCKIRYVGPTRGGPNYGFCVGEKCFGIPPECELSGCQAMKC